MAIYTIDEGSMELVVQLPNNFPLRPVIVYHVNNNRPKGKVVKELHNKFNTAFINSINVPIYLVELKHHSTSWNLKAEKFCEWAYK